MTIPTNLFSDNNFPALLTYSINSVDDSGKSQTIPSYISFDPKTNLLSSNPKLSDMNHDTIDNSYSKNLSLTICAANAAGNKACYPFKFVIINYAPEVQYSLFKEDKVQIDVAPWSLMIPGNLFSDPNNFFNPTLKYSVMLVSSSGDIL